tara:strand:+ start:71 stop:1123 length:1053 start_codon:yes stop_codon:yes gene_type:complete
MKKIKFHQAINKALEFSLNKDSNLILYGLGVSDPKEIFDTTIKLQEKFGPERVFDVPNSENALTGIGIGYGMIGGRVVMTHQRLDFSLLSLDQIINNAAKLFYTSDGKFCVPITIRLIIGRGWGQGPNHSQALQSLYAHIPGLKVVSPSDPNNAYHLLISSIFDNNPTIFLEHRWLHNQEGIINNYKIKKIKLFEKISSGKDLTIVCNSIMTVEAIKTNKIFKKNNINCDIINLLSLNPIDFKSIIKSVKKTGKLIVLDIDHGHISVASEIISKLASYDKNIFKKEPIKICLPDYPVPTSPSLTKKFYPNFINIVKASEKLLSKKIKVPKKNLEDIKIHDIPYTNYTGPF